MRRLQVALTCKKVASSFVTSRGNALFWGTRMEDICGCKGIRSCLICEQKKQTINGFDGQHKAVRLKILLNSYYRSQHIDSALRWVIKYN